MTDEQLDIPAMLREQADELSRREINGTPNLMRDAADLIDSLRSRLAEARAEVEEFKRIRDLLVRALCRALEIEWHKGILLDAPLTMAIQHAEEVDSLRTRLAEVEADNERLTACICGGAVGDYEGPLRDCPIHGDREAAESKLAESQAREVAMVNVVRKAAEWSAGFPLGGGMDEHAARDVYDSAMAVLEAASPSSALEAVREAQGLLNAKLAEPVHDSCTTDSCHLKTALAALAHVFGEAS